MCQPSPALWLPSGSSLVPGAVWGPALVSSHFFLQRAKELLAHTAQPMSLRKWTLSPSHPLPSVFTKRWGPQHIRARSHPATAALSRSLKHRDAGNTVGTGRVVGCVWGRREHRGHLASLNRAAE